MTGIHLCMKTAYQHFHVLENILFSKKFYRSCKKAVIAVGSHLETKAVFVALQWQHYESYVNFETVAEINKIILAKCMTCVITKSNHSCSTEAGILLVLESRPLAMSDTFSKYLFCILNQSDLIRS